MFPEWTIYIETPYAIPGFSDLKGFFCSLEYNISDPKPQDPEELRILLVGKDRALLPISLMLGDWTVEEAVKRIKDSTHRIGYDADPILLNQIAEGINPFISLIFWICSDASEIADDYEPAASPKCAV